MAKLTELIAQASWREAESYRNTFPHEYIVAKRGEYEELLEEICKRFCDGEGVDGKFFSMRNKYLFIGDYKYWLMTPCAEIDLDRDNYVLNRAPIYRDRRDFLIREGDNGRRDKELDWRFSVNPSAYYLGDEIPVRAVWLAEDSDFTPWLAKNLSSLGEALDMKLELVREESDAGRYRVDILADDSISGGLVVIENQLEWTNHDHLGKVITYAGWHDADTLIWVAPTFYEEHRAALDWINRKTSEDVKVFGVELRAVQSGDTEAAIEFVPVVHPALWTKRDGVKPTMAKIQSVLMREFYQPLVDDMRNAGFTDRQRATAKQYQPFPAKDSSVTYHGSFESGDRAWVWFGCRELNILRKNSNAADIERELALSSDTKFVWRTAYGSLGVHRDGSLNDEDSHDEIRRWMYDHLVKFNKVFNQRIEDIRAEIAQED
ncbi:MAG: hypothetical protein OXH22_11580 [Chloroflexi bacterium]|nr:hypothetical protein [Chloroflexota bacterium]